MGARHLIAVYHNGEYKIAQYGQWDGYPERQGIGVLDFIRNSVNVISLKSALSKVRFFDREGKDKDFLDEYDKNCPKYMDDPDPRTPQQKRWFELYISRNLGSDILSNVAESEDEEILLSNHIDFANDSLFCEFAYVIDFDKNTFEVYRGFNNDQVDSSNRFQNPNPELSHSGDAYYPVKLWHSFDLNKLPTNEEFINLCTEEDED